MQLTLWTYEGPPHVGAMRIATAMRGVHYVLHAPQGDTYADLLFTMIERRDARPPVTYTTFQARDLGGDTAELFKTAAREAYERFKPEALLVGASCTAELIQDDPGGLAQALRPARAGRAARASRLSEERELGRRPKLSIAWCAPSPDRMRRRRAGSVRRARLHARHAAICSAPPRSASVIATTCTEIVKLLGELGIDINVAAPLGATPADLARLGDADFNVVLYPEIARATADWLAQDFRTARDQDRADRRRRHA